MCVFMAHQKVTVLKELAALQPPVETLVAIPIGLRLKKRRRTHRP
jgi:hypothetical protein